MNKRFCKFCKEEMVFDEIRPGENGCKDKVFICPKCGMTLIVSTDSLGDDREEWAEPEDSKHVNFESLLRKQIKPEDSICKYCGAKMREEFNGVAGHIDDSYLYVKHECVNCMSTHTMKVHPSGDKEHDWSECGFDMVVDMDKINELLDIFKRFWKAPIEQASVDMREGLSFDMDSIVIYKKDDGGSFYGPQKKRLDAINAIVRLAARLEHQGLCDAEKFIKRTIYMLNVITFAKFGKIGG